MKIANKDINECVNWKEINKLVRDKDPNVYIDNLKKVENLFENFLKTKIITKKQELKKENCQCEHCKCYFKLPTEDKLFYESVTHKNVTVYTDSGEGDNDEYADVDYTYEYCTCPRCGKKTKTKSDWIRRSEVSGTRRRRGW